MYHKVCVMGLLLDIRQNCELIFPSAELGGMSKFKGLDPGEACSINEPIAV